ncbi:zinc ABC transporter permease [Gracilibacillus halophilus YIM-C55.5]|uniref:Zinc ABC transporter permease n=1 Tax=Gracilibacillus halophilus YIM-C55.5 TaxID=1308866 RepID=N4W947_9BACI|nr:zinc ABC transporter permease [Gracilibacillus halophilus YIM-C55.5]
MSSQHLVGVLLVSALMTLPVASSIQIAKGFKQTIIYAIIFGETFVILGLISGYYLEIPPDGTIVVLLILILLTITFVKNGWHRLKKT